MMGTRTVAESCPSSSLIVLLELLKSSPGVARVELPASVPMLPITASYATSRAPGMSSKQKMHFRKIGYRKCIN